MLLLLKMLSFSFLARFILRYKIFHYSENFYSQLVTHQVTNLSISGSLWGALPQLARESRQFLHKESELLGVGDNNSSLCPPYLPSAFCGVGTATEEEINTSCRGIL
jgi:hypothetical protein